MAEAQFQLFSPKGNLIADLNSTIFPKKIGMFDDNCYESSGSFTDSRLIGKKAFWFLVKVIKAIDKEYVTGYNNEKCWLMTYPAGLDYDSTTGTFSWYRLGLLTSGANAGKPGTYFTNSDGTTTCYCTPSCRWIYGYYGDA